MTVHTVSKRRARSAGYRPWAVGGMLGGACTSIAANVAHVYVPPVGVHGYWVPPIGAVIGAVVWPLALLGASEVLARKRWACTSTRVLGTVAVLVVAITAAVISYQHLHDLLLYYRETELSAMIGPLGIDGLMVVCSVALIAADAPGTPAVHTPDTVTPCPDTPPEHTPVTPPVTPVHVHGGVLAPVAAASTPRPGTVTVPVTHLSAPLRTEPDPGSLAHDAGVLQARDVHTLRRAMDELHCGQARARRALALAWPVEVGAGS